MGIDGISIYLVVLSATAIIMMKTINKQEKKL